MRSRVVIVQGCEPFEIQESIAVCVWREFLLEMRRNMRDDQRVVAIITQFQHVTHAMDLRNERRLIGRNSKT